MRFTNGWIKLHRDIWNHEDISRNPLRLAIWVTLLAWATRHETTIEWKGKPRKLPPGSVLTAMKEMADHFGISRPTVHKHLHYLASKESISLEVLTVGTLITISNWSEYQDGEEKVLTRALHGVNNGANTRLTRALHGATLNGEEKKEEDKKEEEEYTRNEPIKLLTQVEQAPQQLTIFEDETLLVEVKAKRFKDLTRSKMRAFIACYSKAYKAKYGGAPECLRDKALIGKIGHWVESISEERAINLIEAYLQIEHKFIEESCHSLWLFFRYLNKIGAALDSGYDTNKTNMAKVFAMIQSEQRGTK